MPFNEADTRANLIDPALAKCGWTADHIRREKTKARVEIDTVDGKAKRRGDGRVDYLLRYRVNPGTQPVAVALIEAKAESKTPGHGLQQAKDYRERHNVPFVFSSNGHLFVEYDDFTGLTTAPRPITEFPTPEELRARYEAGKGFNLEAPEAKPLLTLANFEDFFAKLPGREESERSWIVERAAIEAKNFDLKAVNPNRKIEVDTRTPLEIVGEIEARGAEVASAMAKLKTLLT
jgi:hypothetical protein